MPDDLDESSSIKLNARVTFIIGFLALILALSPFKESLDSMKVSFFDYSISVLTFILIMGIILFLSIYFYALDYMRPIFNDIGNNKFLNWFSKFGDVLFVFAILLPVSILLVWVIGIFTKYGLPFLSNYNFISSLLIILLSVVVSIIASRKLAFKLKKTILENAAEEEEISIIEANKAFDDGYYEYMLIKLNDGLLNLLYRKLSEKIDLGNHKMLNKELIELSFKNGVINSEQRSLLIDIRVLRNAAAHGVLKKSISRSSAKELLDKSKQFIVDLTEPNKK